MRVIGTWSGTRLILILLFHALDPRVLSIYPVSFPFFPGFVNFFIMLQDWCVLSR